MTTLREAAQAVRVFVQDSIVRTGDATVLANLYAARDAIDEALSAPEEPLSEHKRDLMSFVGEWEEHQAEVIAHLETERDQLRAEVERLTETAMNRYTAIQRYIALTDDLLPENDRLKSALRRVRDMDYGGAINHPAKEVARAALEGSKP